MFALPFVAASAPSTSLKPGEMNPGQEAEEGLLATLGGSEGGFSAELQALMMQMTPQMLARLESLMAGGMALPQAARQLLSETAAGWSTGLPGNLLDGELAKPGSGRAAKPDAGALLGEIKTPVLPQALSRLASEPTQLLASLQTAAAVGSTGTQVSPGNGMPPQVAASLLEMGLPQQVGSRAWAGGIAERVMWMAQGDQQFARLSLNPPQLGPLEVRVSINQEQTSVTFLSAHAAVRDALDAAMPRLRELFDQQAMSLVHAEVADPGTHGEGRAGLSSQTGGGSGADDGGQSATDDSDGLVVEHPFVSARGLVDLFA